MHFFRPLLAILASLAIAAAASPPHAGSSSTAASLPPATQEIPVTFLTNSNVEPDDQPDVIAKVRAYFAALGDLDPFRAAVRVTVIRKYRAGHIAVKFLRRSRREKTIGEEIILSNWDPNQPNPVIDLTALGELSHKRELYILKATTDFQRSQQGAIKTAHSVMVSNINKHGAVITMSLQFYNRELQLIGTLPFDIPAW